MHIMEPQLIDLLLLHQWSNMIILFTIIFRNYQLVLYYYYVLTSVMVMFTVSCVSFPSSALSIWAPTKVMNAFFIIQEYISLTTMKYLRVPDWWSLGLHFKYYILRAYKLSFYTETFIYLFYLYLAHVVFNNPFTFICNSNDEWISWWYFTSRSFKYSQSQNTVLYLSSCAQSTRFADIYGY